MEQLIKGKIQWLDLNMGFWGLTTSEGEQWELIDLPKAHQKDDLEIVLLVRELDTFSINMWGRIGRVIEVR